MFTQQADHSSVQVVQKNKKMAERSSPGLAIEESIARDIIESIKQSGRNDVEILMMGKTGSGKTSLAGALLNNKSSGGSFGPAKGTSKLFSSKHLEIPDLDITVTVHDIIGFEDRYVTEEEIVAEIKKGCEVSKLITIILCLRWSVKLDISHQRILKVVDGLGKDVWKKVVVALTFCDELSPEISVLKEKEKTAKLEETYKEWQLYLQIEVLKLRQNADEALCDVIENMPIVPTSHTHLTLGKFYTCLFKENITNWLENIWNVIIQNVMKYQPQGTIPRIISMLVAFLANRFQCSGKMTIEDVKKILSPKKIAGAFLGTSIGAMVMGGAMGSISSVLLGEIIAAAIGLGVVGATATVLSGGIFAGVCIGAGAVASIVIVIIYCIHRHRNRKLPTVYTDDTNDSNDETIRENSMVVRTE